MTVNDVQQVLDTPPFSEMNPESFPDQTPLPDLLLNDSRIRRPKKGEILFKRGDYGNSVFVVLEGQVTLVLPPGLRRELLGRGQRNRRSTWQSLTQLFLHPPYPETRRLRDYKERRSSIHVHQDDLGWTHSYLQNFPDVLADYQTTELGKGEIFGELAVLNRAPRSHTAIAASDETTILEIRWQGLRELMRCDAELKSKIETTYRKHAVGPFLLSLDVFKNLSPEDRRHLVAHTTSATYGEYDWSMARAPTSSTRGDARQEAVIFEKGDYVNDVAIIRAGFARVSVQQGNRRRTLQYLGTGELFGLEDVRQATLSQSSTIEYSSTLSAVGFAHILLLPASLIAQVLYPGPSSIPTSSLTVSTPEPKESSESAPQDKRIKFNPALWEFFAENSFLNGTATMLINLDTCTRCDACVQACASTHNNNPRFVRHGPIHQNVMVANACMHCADPVCMLGCPTGAIHRDEAEGQVVINDITCIGCGACADRCPYDAIRMVDITHRKGRKVISSDGFPVLKATKCDLCIDQQGGPACQRACPYDALRRADMQHLDLISDWAQT